MGYYPLFLDVTGRRCVVVGGGEVAARKVGGLLEAGAHVTVIAPAFSAALARWAAEGDLERLERAYRPGDLKGAALAVAAAGDAAVNRAVWQEATALGIPVNVVDEPACSTFIAPAVVRRGSLVVAISTGGRCPALAAWLRRRIEALVGPEYGELTELLGSLRGEMMTAVPDPARRRAVWERMLRDEIVERLTEGGIGAVRQYVTRILEEASYRTPVPRGLRETRPGGVVRHGGGPA